MAVYTWRWCLKRGRQDIHRYLGDRPVTILHFSCHGEREQRAGRCRMGFCVCCSRTKKIFGDYVPNEWLLKELTGKGIKVIVLKLLLVGRALRASCSM